MSRTHSYKPDERSSVESPLSVLDRDEVWYWWGVDLCDASRMPRTAEQARKCLWRWRGGEYVRDRSTRLAPGDLERLESIAAGHGDPTGDSGHEPPTGKPRSVRRCIDWSKPPVRPMPTFPGLRGWIWEWRLERRTRGNWLRHGVPGYTGPREWHRVIADDAPLRDA